MGCGFYMLHGCIQVFASELSRRRAATALSLHSFFFFMRPDGSARSLMASACLCREVPTLLHAPAHLILGSRSRGCCRAAAR